MLNYKVRIFYLIFVSNLHCVKNYILSDQFEIKVNKVCVFVCARIKINWESYYSDF